MSWYQIVIAIVLVVMTSGLVLVLDELYRKEEEDEQTK